MHKGIIILTKAGDKSEATTNVNSFLDEGGEQIFDWYVIGGRWTGVLDKYDPEEDERNYETCLICGGTGLRNDDLGKEHRSKDPDYKCNGCATYNNETKQYEYGKFGKGRRLKWSLEPHANNVMLLAKCIDVVREWSQDPIIDGMLGVNKAVEWLNGERGKNDYRMYGYALHCASLLLRQSFSPECNVYNIESFDFSIPENIDDYYAVMVDIHH